MSKTYHPAKVIIIFCLLFLLSTQSTLAKHNAASLQRHRRYPIRQNALAPRAPSASGTTHIVTTASDNGAGSLRQAIDDAASGGPLVEVVADGGHGGDGGIGVGVDGGGTSLELASGGGLKGGRWVASALRYSRPILPRSMLSWGVTLGQGFDLVVKGSFDQPGDPEICRVPPQAIYDAGLALGKMADVHHKP